MTDSEAKASIQRKIDDMDFYLALAENIAPEFVEIIQKALKPFI